MWPLTWYNHDASYLQTESLVASYNQIFILNLLQKHVLIGIHLAMLLMIEPSHTKVAPRFSITAILFPNGTEESRKVSTAASETQRLECPTPSLLPSTGCEGGGGRGGVALNSTSQR